MGKKRIRVRSFEDRDQAWIDPHSESALEALRSEGSYMSLGIPEGGR